MNKGKKIALGLTLIIVALLIGRIVYVNITYPKTASKTFDMSEVITFKDQQIQIKDFKVYSKSQWLEEIVGDDYEQDALKNDYYVYVLDLHVSNLAENTNKIDLVSYLLESGALGQSFSNYNTAYLNHWENASNYLVLEGKEQRDIKLAYIIYENFLEKSKWEKILDRKYYLRLVSFENTYKIKLSMNK